MLDLIPGLNSTDAEDIVHGAPYDATPEDEPTAADIEWYINWVLSGAEAEYAEAHADWYHGARTEGQARYLNSGL